MSQLTNIYNLPSSIVSAVRNDPYDRGDAHISVTGLIAPARMKVLEAQHRDEIVEDVTDRIWQLIGQIGHGILERADNEGVREDRLFIERYGWRISGQFDRLLLEDGLLQDYKFTSVYAVQDGVKPEYEAQMNVYALMLREQGHDVKKAQIVAVLRDWSKTRMRRQKDYPLHQVVVLDVNMWPRLDTERFIYDRLMAHGMAWHELPECTAEERWASDDVWKVRKIGNKTAYRLFKTEAEAEQWTADEFKKIDAKEKTEKLPKTIKRDEIEITFSAGESRRCADYCAAAPFCTQWKAIDPNRQGLFAKAG